MEPIDYEVYVGLEPLDPSLPWDHWDIASTIKKPSQEVVDPQPPLPPPIIDLEEDQQEEVVPPPPPPPPMDHHQQQRMVLLPPPPPLQMVPCQQPSLQPLMLLASVVEAETIHRVVRPDWLPPGWSVKAKVRKNGLRAGHLDKYYEDPTGEYIFKSKKFVMDFLEKGNVNKKRRSKRAAKADDSHVVVIEVESSSRKKKVKHE